MSCMFVFKQKTAYEMRISDWSSDVCSSDLRRLQVAGLRLHIGLLDQRGRAIGAIVLRDDPVQRFGRGLRLAGVRLVERGDQRLRLLAAIALIDMPPDQIAAKGDQRDDQLSDDPQAVGLPNHFYLILTAHPVAIPNPGRIVRGPQGTK